MSSGIFFIHEGQVDVYYKDSPHILLMFSYGSYFGDVSFIFQVRNQYHYIARPGVESKFYSLQDTYLYDIFQNFPEFKDVLQIRALRRHHYFRKLKNQQQQLLKIREMSDEMEAEGLGDDPESNKKITNALLGIKKARLIEDKMSYEELAVLENFSEDEITFELNRQIIKDRKDKIALQKARKLEQ